MHAPTGKVLITSKGMDTAELAQLARVGRASDDSYVKEKLAGLFLYMDNYIKTMDMPKLSAEVAQASSRNIAGSDRSQPTSRSCRGPTLSSPGPAL